MISRRTVLGLMPVMPAALQAFAQGPPLAPARLRQIIEAGGYYVIEPDGRVKVWTTSANTKGTVLGFDHDRLVAPYVAQDLPALKGAITIAAGGVHCAVMGDGRVLAWGSNWNGLLGNTPRAELEATTQAHPPVPMPTATLPMPKVVAVDVGEKHVIALTAAGTVFTWGNGQLGQLGIGALPVINFRSRLPETTAYVPYPVQVPDLEGVIGIGAGSNFSLALLEDGTVKAWGDNAYGQLGDGTRETRTRPVTVRGITNAVAVSAGGLDYSAALLRDGTVMTWGWGNGAFGRPGITGGSANPNPMLVPGVIGATAIAAGGQHMLALTAAGKVLSWGDVNVYDPVGRPGAEPVTPGVVPLIANARAVFAGSLSSQALLDDGTFMAWGWLPSLWFRVDGGGSEGSRFPIPMVVKGL